MRAWEEAVVNPVTAAEYEGRRRWGPGDWGSESFASRPWQSLPGHFLPLRSALGAGPVTHSTCRSLAPRSLGLAEWIRVESPNGVERWQGEESSFLDGVILAGDSDLGHICWFQIVLFPSLSPLPKKGRKVSIQVWDQHVVKKNNVLKSRSHLVSKRSLGLGSPNSWLVFHYIMLVYVDFLFALVCVRGKSLIRVQPSHVALYCKAWKILFGFSSLSDHSLSWQNA